MSEKTEKTKMDPNVKRWLTFSISVIAAIIIWFIPVPKGFTVQAWHLFAIFVGTAFGFMLRPFPSGVVTYIELTATLMLKILQVRQAFEEFSSVKI